MRKTQIFVKEKIEKKRKRGGGSERARCILRSISASDEIELDIMFVQKLSDFGRWLLVRKHMVCLGNAAQPDHCVAAEFGVVSGEEYLVGVSNDGLRYADFPVIKVQQ